MNADELLRVEGLLDVGQGAFLEVAAIFCYDLYIIIIGLDIKNILCGDDADEAIVFYYDAVLVALVDIVFEQCGYLRAVFICGLLQPFLHGFFKAFFGDGF